METIELVDLGPWQDTRDTLHAYCRVLSAVPRMWLAPHPNWWHISLQIRPEGLVTREITTPSGQSTRLRMDLRKHRILLEAGSEALHSWDMQAGLTATQLAEQIFEAYQRLGVEGAYARNSFEDDSPRAYDPAAANRYEQAIQSIGKLLTLQSERLPGKPGPVQLWAHGFDVSLEWYGTRKVTSGSGEEGQRFPAQINFGWAPGDRSHPDPYFYSNPWPFDAALTEQALPAGASWFQEGWEGTIFPYNDLVGDPRAGKRLLEYFGRVFEIAEPVLMV